MIAEYARIVEDAQTQWWLMENTLEVPDVRTSLCVMALQKAFWRRKPPPGLRHHSDRGSQYASREYREHLAVMRVEQSMSRKGNCWEGLPLWI